MRKSTLTVLDGGKTRPAFRAPPGLPRACVAHYQAICRHLWDGGKFHETDALLVAQYCLAHHEADRARMLYEAEGLVVEGAQGLKAHPAIAIANQCRAVLTKLASTLALGPAHRHRIAATVETQAGDSGWHSVGKPAP